MFKKINDEIVKAMRAKDSFRLDVLKMMKTELQNNQKAKMPQPELAILSAYYKKLAKGLEIGNAEFVDKLKKELVIVSEFLPKELSDLEIEEIVKKHISLSNVGLVMKAVKAEIESIGSMFDGKKVNEIIKKIGVTS